MGIDIEADAVARLRDRVHGGVYVRGDERLAAEVACFNPAVRHDPDVVVAVADEHDVAEAVRFAREQGLPVRVQATGHGAEAAIEGGLIVSTRALDTIAVDPGTHLARLGAGVRWAPVIALASEHGLAPVTGSSTSVGAVGYTLGGGLGPAVAGRRARSALRCPCGIRSGARLRIRPRLSAIVLTSRRPAAVSVGRRHSLQTLGASERVEGRAASAPHSSSHSGTVTSVGAGPTASSSSSIDTTPPPRLRKRPRMNAWV